MARTHTLGQHCLQQLGNAMIAATGSGGVIDTRGYTSAMLTQTFCGTGSVATVIQTASGAAVGQGWSQIGVAASVAGSSVNGITMVTSVNLKHSSVNRYLRTARTVTGNDSRDFVTEVWSLYNAQGTPVTQTNTAVELP